MHLGSLNYCPDMDFPFHFADSLHRTALGRYLAILGSQVADTPHFARQAVVMEYLMWFAQTMLAQQPPKSVGL